MSARVALPPAVRRRQRNARGQAIIETAIVIPVLLALISAFLAVMVQVEAQQQLEAATKLAAESYFQASRLAVDAPGTSCCPDTAGGGDALRTDGMPKGCRYAAESFYGTMSFRRFLTFAPGAAAAHPLCRRDGVAVGPATGADVTCEIDLLDTTLNPPQGLRVVRCTSSAALDFSRTPLAWAVPWRPTISASAEAIPPPFRR